MFIQSDQPNGSTLIGILREHAVRRKDQTAFIFLKSDGQEAESVTYGELYAEVRAFSVGLLRRGYRPGDRVLVVYPSNLTFIKAFLGVLDAGMVAVPTMIPRAKEGVATLVRIADNAGASGALISDATLELLRLQDPGVFEQFKAMRATAVEDISFDKSISEAVDWTNANDAASRIAFLQYTSGSTGKPKGVVVTHGNLLDNQHAIADAFGHDTTSTVVVGWLPLYHDMGLIGNVLQPLFLGRPCILMSPMDFMVRPVRWLQAIERYKATTSGGPNFAYELLLKKVSQEVASSLDLSSWKLAFNGAEPVRAATMARFSKQFRSAGFSSRAFYPCYGLAECTLLVAGGKAGAGSFFTRDGVIHSVADNVENPDVLKYNDYVALGAPRRDNLLRIVDPDKHTICPVGQVGEIWVSGASVANGYWGDSDASSAAFGFHLPELPDRRFHRTGDEGFVDSSGQLFVVGRLKDMVILRGANYYAEDLESVAGAACSMLGGTRCVAFSIESAADEELIIIIEAPKSGLTEEEMQTVIDTISNEITDSFGIRPALVATTRYGTLPTTTSGKIRRKQCRVEYTEGRLPVRG
ncbi:fatty acyl-AMP ligase [Paraburkholderia jirisanensis]